MKLPLMSWEQFEGRDSICAKAVLCLVHHGTSSGRQKSSIKSLGKKLSTGEAEGNRGKQRRARRVEESRASRGRQRRAGEAGLS